MKSIGIIYWSGTGNTKDIAELIHKGLQEKGHEPQLLNVSEATLAQVEGMDLLILGSPSMGCEVIEESEMEPFVDSIKNIVAGRSLALFGSYDWGTGEWMDNWEARMEGYGANLLGKGLIVNGAPSGTEAERCIEFGRSLA
ncbi:MAG: flavodoxin [Clostridiaceae bacterium]|nr:flavodoxin [Clostridiaceae bacterium]